MNGGNEGNLYINPLWRRNTAQRQTMPINIRPVVSQGLGKLIKRVKIPVLTLPSLLLYRLLHIRHHYSCR